MFNSVHLHVHIPYFPMKPIVFASIVVVAVFIFNASILDSRMLIAVSKYKSIIFP